MLTTLSLALALGSQGPSIHQGDAAPLYDPTRPVCAITRTSFTLQYATATPCETRVLVRQSDLPMFAFRPGLAPFDAKRTLGSKEFSRTGEVTTWHRITVAGLKPGLRYYYRIYDPGATETEEERAWGAMKPYRREYAVSTEAPIGRKTIIHLPVKVLLMPNVINTESAYQENGTMAPEPPKITPAQIKKIEDEFAVSSRFFWVNSGMRLWVDYRFFIDDRWQAWGPERDSPDAFYKGWPVCRSYAGQDYVGPGGGDFTVLDTANVQRVTKDPVVEARPYSGQIEMAWPRKWNRSKNQWEFYNSGGGTYGVDDFPKGFPGRSQFFAGGDTAWLATHEFHHDLESHGQYSLADREDDRIVFDHFHPRYRRIVGGGKVEEEDWTTNGPHGEHWDGIAYWDRTITDCQWLRMAFGVTETVADADGDGFPDNDPRLPLDETRFGSNPKLAETDGQMNDLAKAMLSTWVPGPLQPSWTKPDFQSPLPNPKAASTLGDGVPDGAKPYPLEKTTAPILAMHVTLDGNPAKWASVPIAGRLTKGGIDFTFKHVHDEAGYYGLFQIKGDWRRIAVVLDGEGLGVYSGVGVVSFEALNTKPTLPSAGPIPDVVDVRPGEFRAPGLRSKASRSADGTTSIEFSLPNGGAGVWYWHGGGREIGTSINVFDTDGRGYSVWEPYHLIYSKMLESHGVVAMPSNPPAEIRAGSPGVLDYLAHDPKLKHEAGWTLEGDVLRHSGDESAVYIDGLKAHDFDLLAVIEAKNDAVLAGFTRGTGKMTAGDDYVGFVGGYGNTRTRLRMFGRELGTSGLPLRPGIHRIQLSRHSGEVWLLVDGKAVAFGADPNPAAVVNRLAILGGYDGSQVLHEVFVRQQ